jgi:carbon-monoxide dehydrogenase small subunit
MESVPIQFNINGEKVKGEFSAHVTLLQALRELGHMEVKNGCEKGDCGSCSVLLDGVPVNACLVLAVQADGRDVTTVRGLGTNDDLHPLQASFVEHGAIQCGFCTPGMLISAKALLDKNPSPSRGDIYRGIAGNLCRCTGYIKIVDAIEAAAGQMKKAKKRPRKR